MKPFLSVVVVSYNMGRELPRTLYTMSAKYQQGMQREDFEVILVDNGSPNPPTREQFADLDIDLTIYSMPSPTHSPVPAINFGLDKSCGRFVGVCIDGARMISPGMFAAARDLLGANERAVVATKGRYLGRALQRDAMLEGYDARAEDLLLEGIDWRNDGYRLFDISVFDESSGGNWFNFIAESNALFAPRSIWSELGGYDESFVSKGGGLVNLDTWSRANGLPDTRLFVLVGEASFHQIHGGVATNGSLEVIQTFYDEYRDIRGRDYAIPRTPFCVHGTPREIWSGQGSTQWKPPRPSLARRVRNSGARLVGHRLGPGTRRIARGTIDVIGAIFNRHPIRQVAALRSERHLADGVEISGLFDAGWYSRQYPDVVRAGYRPSIHYVRFGASQRRQPGPLFDGLWYLDTYEDVRELGLNPLLHFIQHGRYEGRHYRPVPKN